MQLKGFFEQERELSVLEEQGLIQSFEYTHELAWKTLKDFLIDRGNEGIYGSKDAVRASFQTGLIEEGEIWMDMIGSRNDTYHTYIRKPQKRLSRRSQAGIIPSLRNCVKN